MRALGLVGVDNDLVFRVCAPGADAALVGLLLDCYGLDPARARGAQLKAKKPEAGPPGGGEVGLFPADDARNATVGGPFMSKAATLQGRQ